MQQPSAERVWSAAQQLLRTIVNPDIYNLWFAPLRATALAEEAITLEVANDFSELWLKDNYLGLIRDVLASAAGQHLKVNFAVATPKANAPANDAEETSSDSRLESKTGDTERITAHKGHDCSAKDKFDTFVVGSNNTY